MGKREPTPTPGIGPLSKLIGSPIDRLMFLIQGCGADNKELDLNQGLLESIRGMLPLHHPCVNVIRREFTFESAVEEELGRNQNKSIMWLRRKSPKRTIDVILDTT
jgi:hypothetical protein